MRKKTNKKVNKTKQKHTKQKRMNETKKNKQKKKEKKEPSKYTHKWLLTGAGLSLMHVFPSPSLSTLVAPAIHPMSSCLQGWGQVLGCCCCWCHVTPIPFVVIVDVGSTCNPLCKQLLTRLGRCLVVVVVLGSFACCFPCRALLLSFPSMPAIHPVSRGLQWWVAGVCCFRGETSLLSH